MTTLALVLPGVPAPPDLSARRQVTIKAGALSVTLPCTDPAVDHAERADDWVELERPQDWPALVPGAKRLPRFTLDVTVIGNGPDLPADRILQDLEAVVRSRIPCVVAYGPMEAMPTRVTSMTYKSEMRRPGTNEITEATVALAFTKQSDLPLAPGQPVPPIPLARTTSSVSGGAPQRYTVRSTDTLWTVSQRFYGTGSNWRRIGDASGLRDPRRLAAGQILLIP